jgi:DNA-binding transcriptional ArsR family regulator
MSDAGEGRRRRKPSRRTPKARPLRRRKGPDGRKRAVLIKAIAHPLRRRILRLLRERGEPLSPIAIALVLEGPLGGVAYHVHVLRVLGLVEPVDEEQVRNAVEQFYETTPEGGPPMETLLDEMQEEDEEDE